MAQARLLDVANVDAVVGDGAAVDLVEAVDEVGDGGLARARGAHEGDLLARLGVERKVGEHLLLGLVAKGHVVKADVARKRRGGAVCGHPLPALVRALSPVLEAHRALVHLGLKVHGGKDALRSGERAEQEVAELRHLVEGHGRLANKHEVAGKAAHVGEAVCGQDGAQHSHDGVVGVGHGHGDGDHRGGIGLGRRAARAQLLVEGTELGDVGVLVVVGLDHLLALAHLLRVAVELAQAALRLAKEGRATPAGQAHVGDERHVAGNGDDGEAPVEHKEQHGGAKGLDGGLDDVGEAVVERLGDRVDVVGEVAHDVAGARAVKEGDGQALQVGEEVGANL